jgi:hypothetical protein
MRHWYVVHRKGKRLSAAADAFRNFVLEEALQLMPIPATEQPTVARGERRRRAPKRR